MIQNKDTYNDTYNDNLKLKHAVICVTDRPRLAARSYHCARLRHGEVRGLRTRRQ